MPAGAVPPASASDAWRPGAGRNPATGPAQVEQVCGTLALFDMPSGKQVGYFGGIKRQVQRGVNIPPGMRRTSGIPELQATLGMLEILHVAKGTIYARTSVDCMAIDRETLRVQWCIPTPAAAVGDGMLFVSVANGPANLGGVKIVAVPLEVK